MGRPTGLEPQELTEAKSLEHVDLVECYFLGTGNKKQEVAWGGSEMQDLGQLSGNLGKCHFSWPRFLWDLAATYWGRLRSGQEGI